MPSDYTFCGYDMLSPESRAGKSATGINLNSVSTQYALQNSPEFARNVYEGIIPSCFGPMPTCTSTPAIEVDGGSSTLTKGDDSMNPMQLAQGLPVAQFPGALGMFHDANQPIQPGYGYGMMNPYPVMPYGSYNVPYNYSPLYPWQQVNSQAMLEWNQYQRQVGARAPVPLDTDFKEPGFFYGFGEGFDPHQDLDPGPDDFYDITLGGKINVPDELRKIALMNNAMTWGYQPGQVVERREAVMYPGINENHLDPLPKEEGTVKDYMGRPQRRLGNTINQPIPASSLPISNMVATNPYMAGVSMIGGYGNPYMQQRVPSPIMQARYNYAIACGFQSVQEMDRNDFKCYKIFSRLVHHEMSKEEFEQFFNDTWCKPFDEAKKLHKQEVFNPMAHIQEDNDLKFKVTLKCGDTIIADSEDNRGSERIRRVNFCRRNRVSPQQLKAELEAAQYERELKDTVLEVMFQQAPERDWDHKSMLDFMQHGFPVSRIHDLNMREDLDRRNPVKIKERDAVNQAIFMRNALERGIGLPAASGRIKMENQMFYKGEELPEEELKGVQRGDYGINANGELIGPNQMPLYGYNSYIPDPDHPERSIGFPRRYIEELYKGFVGYCNQINRHSKSSKIQPPPFEEFQAALNVNVLPNEYVAERYAGIPGAEEYVEAARRGIEDPDFLSDLPPLTDLRENA